MPGLPEVGDEFAGYLLQSVIGRGAMSVVYEAEHPRLGAGIALKVLAAEVAADDIFRTRFLDESRIAASMNHPNVIPSYDVGESDGLLYIAMRRASGGSLRQRIAAGGPLPPLTAVALLSQATRALDAAHRLGLVHRDVKPENLLLDEARRRRHAGAEHLYLADFGISRLGMERNGLTATGQFLGTTDYVAPEQLTEPSRLRLGRPVLARLRAVRVPDRPGAAGPGRPAAGGRRAVRPGAGGAARRPVQHLPGVHGGGRRRAGRYGGRAAARRRVARASTEPEPEPEPDPRPRPNWSPSRSQPGFPCPGPAQDAERAGSRSRRCCC